MYSTLPQLRYQGKYPTSMVSPPETGKERAYHNGDSIAGNGTTQENPVTPTKHSTTEENRTREKPHLSPKSKRSVSPVVRGRSPPPRGRMVDSYRPSSPSRQLGSYRSEDRPRKFTSNGVQRRLMYLFQAKGLLMMIQCTGGKSGNTLV